MDWRDVSGQRLDLDRGGFQAGHIRVPNSTNASAYGSVAVPMISIRNGDGPRVVLMAGNHGDEWEGQIALRRLLRSIDLSDISGQLILLPAANLPAARSGLRLSPLDGGNLNRAFPGRPEGSVTERIAHVIETAVLPGSDLFIDLHSGGASLDYLPGLLAVRPDDPLDRLIDIFAAPVTYVYETLLGGDATSTGAARRQGVPKLGSELGGAGRLSPSGLEAAQDGLGRVLSAVGLWRHDPPKAAGPTVRYRIGGPETYSFSPGEGIFEPLARLGQDVCAGQIAGRLHDAACPWVTPVDVFFQSDGRVICQRPSLAVSRGDCLFHLGELME